MIFLRFSPVVTAISLVLLPLGHAAEQAQVPLNPVVQDIPPVVNLNPSKQSPKDEWKIGQIVKTSSGQIQGHASSAVPTISEYLGIRYAKAPVGDLRFAAPEEYRYEGKKVFTADHFSDNCIGPMNKIEDLDSGKKHDLTAFPGLDAYRHGMSPVRGNPGEDCLSVNVWTKGKAPGSKEEGKRGKAVLFWIHGGGFSLGSSDTRAYDGSKIVDENDVVVVSINYRLSIFGFPTLPGLKDHNVALLDVRMAVEWARDNVAAFGGDPTRITLFGESAGGATADMYSYIWSDDPISHGFIAQSGSAGLMRETPEASAKSWFRVSKKLGCGGVEAGSATLDCMRLKNYTAIVKAMHKNGTSMLSASMFSFGPMIDNKTIFADYEARAAAGLLARKPVLIGSNDNEASLMDVMSRASDGQGFGKWKRAALNKLFTCRAGFAAQLRYTSDIPTWRYRYFGHYPNTMLSNDSGAYHSSEIPLLFGTTGQFEGTDDTEAEAETGKMMRRAWSEFAKNPEDGLTKVMGWPRYDPTRNTLVRLGLGNETVASFVRGSEYDTGCGLGRMLFRLAPYLMWVAEGDDKAEL